ncbi:ABC transporter permease [Bacillus pacificus]
MVNLLYTELLKLKRSNMFLISIIGAGVAPFLVVVASYIHIKQNNQLRLFGSTSYSLTLTYILL